MKTNRFFALIVTVTIALVSFVSCNGIFNTYKLTVVDPVGYIAEALDERYMAGEEVIVRTPMLSGTAVEAYLDEEYLGVISEIVESGQYGYCELRFKMPARDATLTVGALGSVKPPKNDTSGVQSAYFTVRYDYGMHVSDSVTALLNESNLFFDPVKYGVAPLLAGDIVTVYYTGEMYIQETYPSTVVIENGEVTKVEKRGAEIFELEYKNNGWYYKSNGYDRSIEAELPEYVVSENSFYPVSSVKEGATLYATEKARWYDGKLQLSAYALYDYYPLPTVEGKTLFPWMEDLESVVKVRTERHASCNPEVLPEIITSENEKDVGQVCDYLKNLTLREVPAAEWQVEGGTVFSLTVYTATETYTITESAGYIVIDGVGYKPNESIPELVG